MNLFILGVQVFLFLQVLVSSSGALVSSSDALDSSFYDKLGIFGRPQHQKGYNPKFHEISLSNLSDKRSSHGADNEGRKTTSSYKEDNESVGSRGWPTTWSYER